MLQEKGWSYPTIEVLDGTLQMEVEVRPANATDKTVAWSVDNGTGEATISASGLLTAVDDGTVTVIATSADGLVSGELVITISNQNPVVPVTDIIVTGAGGATTIEVEGGSLQMEAEVLPAEATNKTVTWSVTNGTGQASISGSGLLTAVADGTVTVIATSADGLVTGELGDHHQQPGSRSAGNEYYCHRSRRSHHHRGGQRDPADGSRGPAGKCYR